MFSFWAPHTLLYNRTFTLCMVSLFIYAPLCSLRNLAALKYTSTVSVVSTCLSSASPPAVLPISLLAVSLSEVQLPMAYALALPSRLTLF